MDKVKVYMIANLNIEDKEIYRKYEKGFFPILKKHGGKLENAGDIYTYCTPDANWRWRLKEDAKVTFDDVLKEEKK